MIHRGANLSAPYYLLLIIAVVLCGCAWLNAKPSLIAFGGNGTSESEKSPPLQGFYVVTQAVSAEAPKWADTVLEVKAVGDDVRVRRIRIAPLNWYCGHNVTVKAMERLLPHTTVAKVAGKFKLCSYPADDFAGVIDVARRKDQEEANSEDTASHTIVAKCGDEDRLFELPPQQALKFEALKLADYRIAALWDLAGDVEGHVFGKGVSFRGAAAEQDKQFQELGAKIVPDIVSGKFDAGFPDRTCAFAECSDHNAKSALQGYSGVIQDTQSTDVEFVGDAPAGLAKYDLPMFPEKALQNHVTGDVTIKISVDAATGRVKNVEATAGEKVLQDAAAMAAQEWQFRPGSSPKQPLEVTLRFELRCPAL